MSDDRGSLNAVTGARLSMRASARLILDMVDEMTGAEVQESGWGSDDLAALERLAATQIAGVAFGNWPRHGGRE